jgi:hypothetical protein
MRATDHSVTTLFGGAGAVSVQNERIEQTDRDAHLGRKQVPVAAVDQSAAVAVSHAVGDQLRLSTASLGRSLL